MWSGVKADNNSTIVKEIEIERPSTIRESWSGIGAAAEEARNGGTRWGGG